MKTVVIFILTLAVIIIGIFFVMMFGICSLFGFPIIYIILYSVGSSIIVCPAVFWWKKKIQKVLFDIDE